jgi:pyruvate carboxylase subunit A
MKKINKILIANRGEIALRILRTIKEMGLEAVAVYESPDQHEYYLRLVDHAINIGSGPRKDYLNIEKIVDAACQSGADAIHPGYGFLAENADFASACEQAGLVFIGPSPQCINNLGNKVLARNIMNRARIPVIPGTKRLPPETAGIEVAKAFAREHGYPVMLKALAGGGGRGIRKAHNDNELEQLIPLARVEALSAFNDDTIYAEKCIEAARHIEVQILADMHGNIVHLGTRDCSIQRRHQKLLEISPARLPDDVLQSLHEAAIAAARGAGFANVGTVEFLVDPKTNEFWFLEVNTRLQVEHTVSEMLTGVDIVRQQILSAQGDPLEIEQHKIQLHGTAIEVRINAEDPKNRFLPEGGKTVELYRPPGGPGVRLDEFAFQGYTVPKEYDSLLAKMTVRGYGWPQTVLRLKRALNDFLIVGPKTTIPLYMAICNEKDFMDNNFDTSYLEIHPEILNYVEPAPKVVKLDDLASYRTLDGSHYVPITADGVDWHEGVKQKWTPTLQEIESIAKIGDIRSPITGTIREVIVDIGDDIEDGDILIVLEAMKMNTHIVSEVEGTVSEIFVKEGETVDFGEPLIKVSVDS